MRHLFLICDRETPSENSQVENEYNKIYLGIQNVTSGKVYLDMGFCYIPQLLTGFHFGVLDRPRLSALDPVNQPDEVAKQYGLSS